jgi:hypothetical protein
MSAKHDTLYAARLAVQAEITDPARTKKGQVRGKSDYKYVPLDALLEYLRPLLTKHGLVLSQTLGRSEDGGAWLDTVLTHGADECLSCYPLKWDGSSQERGSELTYARRYSLEAILGIAATDDDDGATHQRGSEERAKPPPLDTKKVVAGADVDEDWAADKERFGKAIEGLDLTVDLLDRYRIASGLPRVATLTRAGRKAVIDGLKAPGAVDAALEWAKEGK